MKTIRSNAEQILRENYKGVEDKEDISLKEWVENESVNDPNFYYWLFPDAENLDGDFGSGITDEQKEEFDNFMKSL